MKRILIRVVLAVALLAVGWTAGGAQSRYAVPDFEVAILAPVRETVIECVRGCELIWVERGDPRADAEAASTFQFACKGASVQVCNFGRIGGWIKK